MLTKQDMSNNYTFNRVKDFNPNENLIKEINIKTEEVNVYFKNSITKEYIISIESMENYLNEISNISSYVKHQCEEIEELNKKLFNETEEYNTRNIIEQINTSESNFKIVKNSSLKVLKEDRYKILKEINEALEEFTDIFYRYSDSKYLDDKSLLNYKKNEIDDLINNNNISMEYKLNQIKYYIKDIYAKEEEYLHKERTNKEIMDKYISEYTLYQILCEKLDECLKFKNVISIEEAKVKGRELELEIEVLRNKLKEKEDYEYIVTSINEVMEEMGYDIISSEVLNRVNRNIVDNIYSFNNDSVLNVFTSDNGTIMFEVSGISNEKKEISSLEKLRIKESMDQFCGEYDKIKEKLALRGILFGRENLKPADEKYARVRVINKEKYKVENRKKNMHNVINNKNKYF